MIFSENRYPLFGIMLSDSPHQAHQSQQDDGPDGCVDDLADDASPQPDAEPREQPGRDEGADDADHDVADDAETRAADDVRRQPAGDQADDQNNDDALPAKRHV